MNEPVGDLCVLADPDHRQWSVAICQGGGKREVLQRFDAQDLATDYALEERARRQQLSSGPLTIHFPDDCPCRGNQMKW